MTRTARYLCLPLLPLLGLLSACSDGGELTVYETTSPAAYTFPNTTAKQAEHRGMVWEVPAGWVAVEDIDDQLVADYRLPGKTQHLPGRVTVSNISGDGGGLEANLQRWRRQLFAFEVTSRVPGERVTEPNLIAPRMYAVKAFIPGQGQSEYAPSAMLVTMITLVDNQQRPITTWFFKFTGDMETVTEKEPEFNELVASFQVDPELLRAVRESGGAG